MSLLQRIEKTQPAAGSPSDEQSRKWLGAPQPAEQTKGGSRDLKSRVQTRVISELDPRMDLSDTARVKRAIEDLFNNVLDLEGAILTRAERQQLFEQVEADILGLGPIEPLLNDDTVTEIMVNGPGSVYVERKGKLIRTNVTFQDDDHVLRILDRIIAPLGRRCDESSPMVDARLPDGSRVNAVIPPLSLVGPVITIRKFAKIPLTVDDLINFGTLIPDVIELLRICVLGRLNVVVSGGTGSGKTTLLNVLSSFIPNDERIVTVEDAAELQLRQEHVITVESRPPNIEGRGQVTIRDIVINALRMRPDRIVVGECRGKEALDMLQAMNTGHDGSMTTLHSNSPRDTLARLETMVLMAGMDLPLRAIREQVASAIDLIIHEERFRDGSRKVSHVTEVQGMEGDIIVMQDIFLYEQRGVEDGQVVGQLKATGVRPKFMQKLEANGYSLPPSVFGFDPRSLLL